MLCRKLHFSRNERRLQGAQHASCLVEGAGLTAAFNPPHGVTVNAAPGDLESRGKLVLRERCARLRVRTRQRVPEALSEPLRACWRRGDFSSSNSLRHMTQKCSGVDVSQLNMMNDFALGTEHIGLRSPLVLVSIARRRLMCPESFFSPPLVYPGS